MVYKCFVFAGLFEFQTKHYRCCGCIEWGVLSLLCTDWIMTTSWRCCSSNMAMLKVLLYHHGNAECCSITMAMPKVLLYHHGNAECCSITMAMPKVLLYHHGNDVKASCLGSQSDPVWQAVDPSTVYEGLWQPDNYQFMFDWWTLCFFPHSPEVTLARGCATGHCGRRSGAGHVGRRLGAGHDGTCGGLSGTSGDKL